MTVLLMVNRRLEQDRRAVCDAHSADLNTLEAELAQIQAIAQHDLLDNSLPQAEELELDMQVKLALAGDALQESQRSRQLLDETLAMGEHIVKSMVAHREMLS